MATPKIPRGVSSVRLDGTLAAIGGGQIRIPLKKESLMADHQVLIAVSQTYAGVPTSVDVRRFITDMSVETSDGRRAFVTGYQAYDLGRYPTQGTPGQSNALAATSTSDFSFHINHANEGALYDLFSAIPAGTLTTFDLVINFAADNANGFIGGTVPGVASYTATARSEGYPSLSGQPWVGKMRHVIERVMQPGTAGAGTSYDLRLVAGNLTRYLMLHTFDTTGATPSPSDSILNNLRLTIDGEEKRITTFSGTRMKNAGKMRFDIVGCAVLDFGDDESGWLDLRNVNEPKISVDIASGAPASYLITLAQDYNTLMA